MGIPTAIVPAGPVRRPHVLPALVAKPVPAAAGLAGLHADRDHPARRVERHRAGAGLRRHHPAQAVQDRRGDPDQHPPRAVPAGQRLPEPGPVLPGGQAPGRRITPARPVPGGVDRTRQPRHARSPPRPPRPVPPRHNPDRNKALDRLQRALNPTESVRTRKSPSLQAEIGDSCNIRVSPAALATPILVSITFS